MSYENAPATRMLATRCAVCGRQLVDSRSVETGVGPDCRAKHGYDDPCGEEERREANRLVYRLALWRSAEDGVEGTPDVEEAAQAIGRVRALGLSRLAAVLEERLCDVQLEETEEGGRRHLAVATPFSDGFLADLKRLKRADGFELERRWDASSSRWLLPTDDEARRLLWRVLKVHFKGRLGRGPRGPFAVKDDAKAHGFKGRAVSEA